MESEKENLLKKYIEALKGYPFKNEKEQKECFAPYTEENIIIESYDQVFPLEIPVSLSDFEKKSILEKKETKEEKIEIRESEHQIVSYFPSNSIPNIPIMTISHNFLLLNIEDEIILKNTCYGLIGKNGIGKSSFLKEMSKIKGVYLLNQEESFCNCKFSKENVKDFFVNFFDEKEVQKMLKMFKVEDLILNVCKIDKNKNISYNINEKNNKNLVLNDTDISLAYIPGMISRSDLSGGQKKKLQLIFLFLLNPKLLLLDEPTNMLDFEGIKNLILLIKNYKNTIIVVSHDIYFLNQVCEFILDFSFKKFFIYKGNYEIFKKQKDEKIKVSRKEKLNLENKKEKLKNLKMKFGVRKSSLVISKYKQLDKEIEKFENNYFEEEIDFKKFVILEGGKNGKIIEIKEMNIYRKGNEILTIFSDQALDELKSDSKTNQNKFDKNELNENFLILKNLCFILKGNQKILLIGNNGVGKSTFLTSFRDSIKNKKCILFQNLKILWIGQDHLDNFKENDRVIPFLIRKYYEINNLENSENPLGDKILIQKIRKVLSKFSLQKDYHEIKFLSGGEKTKILLSLLILTSPDLLLLDEITNNLDINTIEIWKNCLSDYKGCVIAISHDRWFGEIFNEVWEIKDKNIKKGIKNE